VSEISIYNCLAGSLKGIIFNSKIQIVSKSAAKYNAGMLMEAGTWFAI